MLDHNYFWGMHTFWWFVWVLLFFWVYATPYDIPGQRRKKEAPMDVLKKRYASGEIKQDEYLQIKKDLEAGGK
ncbi:MAG: SHOCT domain-containing protein [Bacteroidia bacterium]|nr:SHOCT domain-containing protein [Bacteroidia bacterium]